MSMNGDLPRRAAERYMLLFRITLAAPLAFLPVLVGDFEDVAVQGVIAGGFLLATMYHLDRIAVARETGLVAAHRWARTEDRAHGRWRRVVRTPAHLAGYILLFVAVSLAASGLCWLVRHLIGV